MNKRQKKKKGLLVIEKVYSNYGKKKNKSIKKKEVEIIKENKVTEAVRQEETPLEEVKEEKEVKEENK